MGPQSGADLCYGPQPDISLHRNLLVAISDP